ncbi:IclR family transcriptional regulator [Pontiella sulfatireligans]|uniref:HTH-type transcriptional repressor AllR n=1 Tax=Pontiella sulfatireligans TaxID=2750658 RepID=A0A6C2UML3_9BACT|nr:IclR family transcriptional regulator [Pontiella sulfatireligans]VGO20511.1 HTH-type transcriptional repressor AllR [Pontiella sulfatireligans]
MNIQANREELAEFKMTNLERGLTIMELLTDYPDGLGTSEIARMLDLPKNFIFRATRVLHLRGYLDRNEDSKTFSVSRKLLSMSYHVLKHTSLIEVSMPLMKQLRNEIKETVTLSAIEGAQGIVLDYVPSPHSLRLVVETGAHYQLHSSAPGKAMLAFMPEEDRDYLIEQLSFEKFTSQTITSKKAFFQALESVRKAGYAVDLGEELEGIHCLSAPVFDEKGFPVAALVVTGPASRFPVRLFKERGELLRQAAVNISTKLGCAE